MTIQQDPPAPAANITHMDAAPKPKPSRLARAPELGRILVPRAMMGSDTEAYVITVTGDCLSPEVNDGDYAVASPNAPVTPGKLVILYPNDGDARIKRAVMMPPASMMKVHPDCEFMPLVIVEQLNPPRRYTVPVDKLEAVHGVLGVIPRGEAIRPGEASGAPPAAGPTCHAGACASLDEAPATVETLAKMKFAAPEDGPIESGSSIESWCDRARLEFALAQRLLPIFNSSDDELEQTIRAHNDPEMYMTIVDHCIAAKNRAKDAAEFYGSGAARVMVVLARLYGDEAVPSLDTVAAK